MTEEPTARERASRRDQPLVQRAIVADALIDPDERARIGFDPAPDAAMPVVVELNLRHREGLPGARRDFLANFHANLPGKPEPEPVTDTDFRCLLNEAEILALVHADQREPEAAKRTIYRVWPDFPVHPLIDGSCATVKADAARRSYDAAGRGVTWAVLDSGIDEHHLHFRRHATLEGDVADLHRDFTQPGEPKLGDALVDRFYEPAHPETPSIQHRLVRQPETLAGIARESKLVSLKVLDDRGNGHSMNVVRALEYVRRDLNGYGKLLRVHGVNLSLGYEFDPKWFACGQSPICAEV